MTKRKSEMTPEQIERRRSMDRARYASDPARHRDRATKYRDANRETVRANQKRSRIAKPPVMTAEQRERKNVRARERRAENYERVRAIEMASRAAHLEEVRAFNRAYNKAQRRLNPEHSRAMGVKAAGVRRARELGAYVEPVDPRVVYERDGGICRICDCPVGDAKWHVDHIIPVSRGGLHAYSNAQLAHAACNLKKWAKVPA